MRTRAVSATKGLTWVVVFALFVSCVAWWPMLTAYPHTQTRDGMFFHKMIEVARVSVVRFHELPLWNPFECGGVPLWDNPQGIAGAPLTWLTLLFGTTRTVELWYVLHTALGIPCMWALARAELRLSPGASLVAAASWALAGVHNIHFAGGHVVWVAYLYFPLAILLWRRAESDVWAAVGTGLVVALTIYEGGTYPLPYLASLLGVETLLRVWPPRRFVRIARAAVVVVVVALTVGAARFLPVFDQLLHHHRALDPDTDWMKWETLKDVFLSREHDRYLTGQQYVFPEYWDYIGPILLTLSAVGIFFVRATERWLVILFLFSFALMCGHFDTYAPWSVLNGYVYPFKQMRVPSRFVVLVTLFLSIFAGMAVDRIPRLFGKLRASSRELLAGALVALAMVGVGDELSVGELRISDNRAWRERAFDGPPQSLDAIPHAKLFFSPPRSPDLRDADGRGGLRNTWLEGPDRNTPDLGCWEEWAFNRDAPLWMGDVPQARAATPNVNVLDADRTANTFTVELDASGPGRVLLNSTYDRGWRTDNGAVVEGMSMLAVDVPPGRYALHLHYWPHGLTLGIFLSGFSSVGLAVLFIRSRRRLGTFVRWRTAHA